MKPEIANELKKICNEPRENTTKFYTLKDIKLTLLDYTKNPYKSMFNMALMTWGNLSNKWDRSSPELRFEVVKAVLEKKALPLALEAPYFVFLIENVSRASFDQIARARIGVVFAAKGYKDDFLNDLGFMIPSVINDDAEARSLVKMHVDSAKTIYSRLQNKFPNWAARCVLPHYSQYSYIIGITYKSLQELCSKRMQTTEMEDTVATAWFLRDRVRIEFPLLAEYLRPACDFNKKDTTVAVNGFSDILGIPHPSDNRQPGFEKYKGKVLYDNPCTDINLLRAELNIQIPMPDDFRDYEFNTLSEKDTVLFQDAPGPL